MLKIRLLVNSAVTVLGTRLTPVDREVSLDPSSIFFNAQRILRGGALDDDAEFKNLGILLDKKFISVTSDGVTITSLAELKVASSGSASSDATKIRGRAVTAAVPANSDFLQWDAGTNTWVYGPGGGGGGGGTLQTAFNFGHHPEISLGMIPANVTIGRILVEVLASFGAGVGITIGDGLAMARLMPATGNDLLNLGSYALDSGYKYAAITEVKAYFVGAIPVVGSGRVVVYYS